MNWQDVIKIYLGKSIDCNIDNTTLASEITSLTIDYSTVYSGTGERKHQGSASLVFVRGIHRWPVNSPHKGALTRKMFPFDDVIMTGLIKYTGSVLSNIPFVQFSSQFTFHKSDMDQTRLYIIHKQCSHLLNSRRRPPLNNPLIPRAWLNKTLASSLPVGYISRHIYFFIHFSISQWTILVWYFTKSIPGHAKRWKIHHMHWWCPWPLRSYGLPGHSELI